MTNTASNPGEDIAKDSIVDIDLVKEELQKLKSLYDAMQSAVTRLDKNLAAVADELGQLKGKLLCGGHNESKS